MTIRNIVVLTGAGISAESGIPVFRSETGLWENLRVEDVATPDGYLNDPDLVRKFYDTMRVNLTKVKPNPGHLALARLAKEWKKGQVVLITQNIDDLHERGGSKQVYHMHGELKKLLCWDLVGGCGNVVEINRSQDPKEPCPYCGKKGYLRPNIVWFGEMPLYMDEISISLSNADLFLSIGTSGVVYPAAGFVRQARLAGAITIEFNLSSTATKEYFDGGVYGPSGQTLPEFVDHFLQDPDKYISKIIENTSN